MGRGAHVYESSPVTEIEEEDGGVKLTVENHTVYAQKLIVATHYPIYDSAFFIAKLAPYRSYAMAIRPKRAPGAGMFISTLDDVRSWRPHEDLLIVGAGCHKVGQQPDTEGEYRKLEQFASETFGEHEVLNRWSAQDNATHDELPYVGRSPGKDHIFVATGFDGWGMSNGIAAARLMTDLIQGNEHLLAETLSPSRMSLKGFGKLAGENLDAVGHLTTDRFRKVREGKPEDLKPGEAGVFAAEGLDRTAAYRDESGQLHECSAICPHFGCQVGWNPAEKTWDCPCHGSRFDSTGKVIQAPAMGDLKPVETKVDTDKRKLM
jgi:nitrite reductase/ring-hydroxylating ferredoxin subunit